MGPYFQTILTVLAICASLTNSLPLLQPRVSHPSRRDRANGDNGRRSMPLKAKQYFYNQTLDHFNYRPESYDTFRQQYLVVDDFWGGTKNNAPVFVYLGDEAPISPNVSDIGFPAQNARHFNALVVVIEHRYYGMSNPKGSMSKSLEDPESVGYFNSAQALADYAEIILFLKQHYKAEHSPVVVFGASYGGTLAAWFRLKYPHVAMGALASSASIFDTTMPSDTYDNWVNKVFRDASETCYETIVRSWGEMTRLGSNPNGLGQLGKMFKTCSALNKTEDLGSRLVEFYRVTAQYDEPGTLVSSVCKAIDGADIRATDLERVANAVASDWCFPVGDSIASSIETFLGWAWQRCSEMVVPRGTIFNSSITNSVTPVNPFDLQTFIQKCKAKYGVPTRPSWVNTYYGSQNLRLILKRSGSNIIFSNGLMDPYSQLGVLESISETLVAVKAPLGSHCNDLDPADENDPEWLKTMRKKEVKIIEEWLSLYYADLRAYLNGH